MKINRRKFIRWLITGIASIEAFFLVKLGIHKSHLTDVKKEWLYAGKADFFERNRTYPFSTGKFFLKRFEDGGFLAISVRCTHLGCVVNIDKNTGGFVCPCHASRFDKYGEVLSAPATRPLDIFPVKLENGELFVDTRKPVRRKHFRKSQLAYV